MTTRSLCRPSRLLTLVTALTLAGCVEGLPDVQVAKGNVRDAIAKGSLASPRAASVALASLEGPPDAVAARFDQDFRKEAADREITVADATRARYLVRGYLSAASTEQGTTLTYVYDVFDASDRRRIERVTDVLTVPGSGPDAWALVDDRAMASLAGRSADDLAMALAATPEARGASGVVAAATPAPTAAAN